MGMRSKKCIIRIFERHNTCIYANLDGIARYAPQPHGTKQHKIKSSIREHDAIKGHSKHKTYEPPAFVTWHTVLHQLFVKSRKSTL